jgi:F-type H+-transporting ATPase subunit epsilon
MEDKLRLEIVTPYGSIFSDDVDEISAAGSEGEFGVFPQHAPFITMLKTGMLTCKKGSENLIFFVSGGYAEVGPDKVVVLGDSAERSEDIDVERAKAAMKRAEERLKKIDDIDFARATASLERSTIRVQIAEKHTLK